MTIPLVESILHTALMRDVPLKLDDQVGFQPPDAAWRARVRDLMDGVNHVSALNVFLVDLLENEPLRSSEQRREVRNGVVTTRPAAFRVDCHYLVSAWYPTEDSDAIIATREEHALLARAIRALVRNVPLNPGRILSDADLQFVPAELQDADLPTRIVPAGGFPKLAEFWSGMGNDIRWRPVVHIVVTIPVHYDDVSAGGIVETIITELGRRSRRSDVAAAETVVTVGGAVVTGAGAPVPFARVQIRTTAGERLDGVTAGPDGRFRFAGLTPGQYTLAWSANGFALPAGSPKTVDVPSSGGRYELQLT